MTQIVVVGAGDSGQRIARELRRSHAVTVLERSAGQQVVSVQSGADGLLQVNTIGEHGPSHISARAVVLATGAREGSLAGRLIAGSPAAGVITGSQLEAESKRVGRTAVILGSDAHAHRALRHLNGMKVAAVVTPWSRPQVGAWSRLRLRSVTRTGAYIERVIGDERVTAVDLVYRDGRRERIACDTVVLTGDFIPEYELAVRTGLLMDRSTSGPAVDGAGRTSRQGVFAVGNVVHPGYSGNDVNAAATAAAIRDYVDLGNWATSTPIDVAAPIDWISPAMGNAEQYVLSASVFRDSATVQVTRGGSVVWRGDVRDITPGVPFVVTGGWGEGAGTVVELI